MTFYQWITETRIADNELWRIVLFFLTLLAVLIASWIARYFMFSSAARMEKRDSRIMAATLRALGSSLGFLAFTIGLKLGVDFLVLNDKVLDIAETAIGVLFVVSIAWLAFRLVDVVDCYVSTSTRIILNHYCSSTGVFLDIWGYHSGKSIITTARGGTDYNCNCFAFIFK